MSGWSFRMPSLIKQESSRGSAIGNISTDHNNTDSVVDPNPQESVCFGWIRIRIRKKSSDSDTDSDPDTVVE
jgi:hypothetical protein